MKLQRILRLSPQELNQIIKLHKETLTDSTLNNFGEEFLRTIYQSIIKSDNNIVLIVRNSNEQPRVKNPRFPTDSSFGQLHPWTISPRFPLDQNKIIGFAVATINISKFYREVAITNPIKLTRLVLKSSFKKPRLIWFILCDLFLTKSSSQILPELQFIAVAQNFQGKGLGSQLINKLHQEFKSLGINSYKVATKKSNKLSNKFYLKLKFKYIESKKVLGEFSNYYQSPIF